MKIVAYGGTDRGKIRVNNEDAYLLNDTVNLFAVADGMGGYEGGEIASRLAVETLAAIVPDALMGTDLPGSSGSPSCDDAGSTAFRSAFELANREIRLAQARNPVLSRMGTTLTALLLLPERAVMAHMGDSRAYLLRGKELTQLTSDHSFVAEQVRAGVFTEEEARTSPFRHIITRALGIDDAVNADLTSHDVQKGDRFLLCTDGLTGMMSDAEINATLDGSSPQEGVDQLLSAANACGGVDNVTAVVVWVAEV